MAQDHLTTTGTQDAGLILPQTQMTKMLEVPSYYSFHVNNALLVCIFGLISSLQRRTQYAHQDSPQSRFFIRSACI